VCNVISIKEIEFFSALDCKNPYLINMDSHPDLPQGQCHLALSGGKEYTSFGNCLPEMRCGEMAR